MKIFKELKLILNQKGWVPIAAAVGSAVIGGVASAQAQKSANKANKDLSREQMAWQEKMSNTAHQREVEDLRKAGLNPILSAGGQGASTGSAQMPEIKAANELQGVENAISSALETRRLKKEVEATDSQIKLNQSAENTQKTQQALNINSAKKMQLENAVIDATLPTVKAQAELNRDKAEIDKKMLKYDSVIDRIKSTGGAGSSVMDMVRPIKIQRDPRGKTSTKRPGAQSW